MINFLFIILLIFAVYEHFCLSLRMGGKNECQVSSIDRLFIMNSGLYKSMISADYWCTTLTELIKLDDAE